MSKSVRVNVRKIVLFRKGVQPLCNTVRGQRVTSFFGKHISGLFPKLPGRFFLFILFCFPAFKHVYRDKNNDYKQRFVGYRFNHILKVEFESDNDRLGKILYALAHCSVKPEFRISYTVKDPEATKNLLLGKAVTDAKEKATVLTQAAGVALKDIQSIDYSWGEINFEYSPMRGDMLMECCEAPMAKSYDLDIEPDDIDVSDTVTVIWEIG